MLSGNKEDIRALRRNAFNKDAVQTDALLLFGIHIIKEGKDINYGLSLVSDAAAKKNDRAAYILGWLNHLHISQIVL